MDSVALKRFCAGALGIAAIGAATASTLADPSGNAAQEPESITLAPGETRTTATVFEQGKKYKVTVSGAVTEVYPKQGDQQMTCVTDAFYQKCTGGPNPGPPSRSPGVTVNSKFANGASLDRYASSGLPPYNSGNTYTLTLDNADPGTFSLRGAAGANPGPGTEVSGSFSVSITPPGAVPFRSVAAPAAGKSVDIKSPKIPPETYKLLLDIVIEQELEQLKTALAVRLKKDPGSGLKFRGCLWVMRVLAGEGDLEGPNDWYYNADHSQACAEFVLRGPEGARPTALVAAKGCRAGFVPVFRPGTKVTKKLRAGAAAAARNQLRMSCKARGSAVAVSLEARGRKARLNGLLGKRVRAPLALFTPSGTSRSEEIGVRWRATKRKR